MRKPTTARDHAAEHAEGDVPGPAEPHRRAWSIPQWRALGACVAEAYTYYERRLVDLRRETIDRLRQSLKRRGLSATRAAGRGAGGRRAGRGRR